MSRWNDYSSDTATERFLRGAAQAEGLSYHAFCDKYGIIDDAGAKSVRRHEREPLGERMKSGAKRAIHARAGRFHRGGLRQQDGYRDPASDPPFALALPSDFSRPPK